MVSRLKGYLLYIVVSLVGLLMLGNIYLIYLNNHVISSNKEQQEVAERIKLNTLDVIRSLHLLDLAIRSYTFVKGDHFLNAANKAIRDNTLAISRLEDPLKSQNFPMAEFYKLKDSVNAYIKVASHMLELISKGEHEQFVDILSKDPGYSVWQQHQAFSALVNEVEDDISGNARTRYEAALKNSYLLQILLFLITIPTLGYTAYYTRRNLFVSEQLRKSEAEKTRILEDQNRLLEKTVYERTREILTQNSEISAQNEEMTAYTEQLLLQQREIELHRNSLSNQNESLIEAKRVIEEQNLLIQQKNNELGIEVARQTRDLKQTNLELIEQNTRLEQFAFIISHNLRAPMARLVGLSAILDLTTDVRETSEIVGLMVKSTQDLDQVIKDLTLILGVQKMNTKVLSDIALEPLLQKVVATLEPEIKETRTRVTSDFTNLNDVTSLHPYMESIFYNLLSNAIKYRHPERSPVIHVKSKVVDGYNLITFEDNGLGIDVERHKESLFNLYKRFHFHTEGKGMGLYLVKTQLTALGGRIEVNSRVNEGTRFCIYLKQGH
ncbi:MAG TPA: HAMP domain-containing sensor histidine kinase [Chryseolinea sp.]